VLNFSQRNCECSRRQSTSVPQRRSNPSMTANLFSSKPQHTRTTRKFFCPLHSTVMSLSSYKHRGQLTDGCIGCILLFVFRLLPFSNSVQHVRWPHKQTNLKLRQVISQHNVQRLSASSMSLVTKGALITAKEQTDPRALHYAAKYGSIDVTRELLSLSLKLHEDLIFDSQYNFRIRFVSILNFTNG